MQIQRIQSLWLTISFILAIVSLCYPWLKIDGGYVTIQNNVPLLVLALLAVMLPLVAIFLYRNLRRQKLVCSIAALMSLFSIGYVVALSYLGPNPESEVCIVAPVAMALSGIFDILARRAIVHDEKLLRSADRLR